MRAHVIMPGNPARVEEQEVPDYLDALVIPLQAPFRAEAYGEALPKVADAYPTVVLARHTLEHTDPREPRRIVAFWPSSWRDQWGMDALRAQGVIS